MSLFKRSEPIIHEWQYMPYGFEPGVKYVIELNASDIRSLDDIEKLKGYFKDNGISCHFMLTKSGNGIRPVSVKTHRDIEP